MSASTASIRAFIAAGLVLVGSGMAYAQSDNRFESAQDQLVVRATERQLADAPEEYFTGSVALAPIWSPTPGMKGSAGQVVFQPGARSHWHTHPTGQYLYILSGTGLTQQWGKPIQTVRAGDVVWCPPGVKHWHGAAPDTSMSHLAVTGMTEAGNVNWLEEVTDGQYPSR